MTFNTPSGSRGVWQPSSAKPIFKWFNKFVASRIRKTGKAFGDMPALILTTVGRKTGAERSTPVAYFPFPGEWRWLADRGLCGWRRDEPCVVLQPRCSSGSGTCRTQWRALSGW
jgi:F420H(2)-dependent quinone reductase